MLTYDIINKVPENMVVSAEERLEIVSEAMIREAESWDWIEK